ncbi:MAG: hypothetical protein SOV26_05565 [Candidatus Onthovivens sp.]|nr:hypothetical protein [Candidatus Onthovivens sp.]
MINLFLYKIHLKDINSPKTIKKSYFKVYKEVENLFFSENNLEVKYSSSGKPLLENNFISISHSGSYLLIALSDENIGIDIEKYSNIGEYVKKILRKNEKSILTEQQLVEKFTFIESFVKYNDYSLLECLRNISTSNEGYKFYKTKISLQTEYIDIDDFKCSVVSKNKQKLNLIKYNYYES